MKQKVTLVSLSSKETNAEAKNLTQKRSEQD